LAIQRPCARGERCRSAETTVENDQTITTPALTADTFCRRDRDLIWRCLAELPELWVRVHGELAVKATTFGDKVAGSRTPPVPPNLAADALMREILRVLASWDERIRTAARLTVPDTQLSRQRRDGRALDSLVRTLRAHLDSLLALRPDAMSRSYPTDSREDIGRIPEGCYGRSNRTGGYADVTIELSGADAGEDILRLHHRARAFLGETRMCERLDVPCPGCDLLMLERRQGSEYAAECRECGRLLTTPELHQWARLFAAHLVAVGVATPEHLAAAGMATAS
jgi:hypothetical protein